MLIFINFETHSTGPGTSLARNIKTTWRRSKSEFLKRKARSCKKYASDYSISGEETCRGREKVGMLHFLLNGLFVDFYK